MILAPTLILGLLAQGPPPAPADPGGRAARLEAMKAGMGSYTIAPRDAAGRPLRLQAEPALRFTNPVGDSEDGAIFFWLGEHGRPEVAAQVFLSRSRRVWIDDFSSLSAGPLVARASGGPAWTPARGGVEFRPVPGATRPADSAEGRLRQMRELAEGFAVTDDFRQKGPQPLRPMPRPLARYGTPGSPVVDGAVFCFALGTDPEAYLMLEARAGRAAGDREWYFAFAPQTTYALRASWRGSEVWSMPDRRNPWNPDEVFFGRTRRPEN